MDIFRNAPRVDVCFAKIVIKRNNLFSINGIQCPAIAVFPFMPTVSTSSENQRSRSAWSLADKIFFQQITVLFLLTILIQKLLSCISRRCKFIRIRAVLYQQRASLQYEFVRFCIIVAKRITLSLWRRIANEKRVPFNVLTACV